MTWVLADVRTSSLPRISMTNTHTVHGQNAYRPGAGVRVYHWRNEGEGEPSMHLYYYGDDDRLYVSPYMNPTLITAQPIHWQMMHAADAYVQLTGKHRGMRFAS